MSNNKLNYIFSRDYDRLKELLDRGCEVGCRVSTPNFVRRDYGFCTAMKLSWGNYMIYHGGIIYVSYNPDAKNDKTFAQTMAEADIEFIDIKEE